MQWSCSDGISWCNYKRMWYHKPVCQQIQCALWPAEYGTSQERALLLKKVTMYATHQLTLYARSKLSRCLLRLVVQRYNEYWAYEFSKGRLGMHIAWHFQCTWCSKADGIPDIISVTVSVPSSSFEELRWMHFGNFVCRCVYSSEEA